MLAKANLAITWGLQLQRTVVQVTLVETGDARGQLGGQLHREFFQKYRQ